MPKDRPLTQAAGKLANLAVTSCKYVGEMSGVAADDEFAVCLRALNLQVQGCVGGRPAVLRAIGYRKYGLAGAKLALIGCAASQLRSILKNLVQQEGLPYSPWGGPWALEAEANRGPNGRTSPAFRHRLGL